MGEKIAYSGAMLCGVVALILLASNVSLVLGNRTLQAQLSGRQSALQNGQAYSQLNQSLVQALADASVKESDSQIRGLLASQGITVTVNAAAPASTDKK